MNESLNICTVNTDTGVFICESGRLSGLITPQKRSCFLALNHHFHVLLTSL